MVARPDGVPRCLLATAGSCGFADNPYFGCANGTGVGLRRAKNPRGDGIAVANGVTEGKRTQKCRHRGTTVAVTAAIRSRGNIQLERPDGRCFGPAPPAGTAVDSHRTRPTVSTDQLRPAETARFGTTPSTRSRPGHALLGRPPGHRAATTALPPCWQEGAARCRARAFRPYDRMFVKRGVGFVADPTLVSRTGSRFRRRRPSRPVPVQSPVSVYEKHDLKPDLDSEHDRAGARGVGLLRGGGRTAVRRRRKGNSFRGFGRRCRVRCDVRWSTPVAGDEQDRASDARRSSG